MKAFVDSREPDNVKLKTLKGSADKPYTWNDKELTQGDFYLPEYDVVVERKEASDFASSTTDGRLSRQADRMVAEHDHVFVVIERPSEPLYDLAYSDVSDRSLIGMQTSLAVKRGINIIYTESVEQTIYAVNRIFERFCDEEHKEAESDYVKTADTGEVDDVRVAMLMQVEGISEHKAKEIVSSDHFHGMSSLFVDGEYTKYSDVLEWITEIDGVGEVLAERVINAFQ